MSGPGVSKHLRVLERAGLVQRSRRAKWRPRSLDAAPIRAVADWAMELRCFWDASFARLDEHLRRRKEQEKADDQHR